VTVKAKKLIVLVMLSLAMPVCGLTFRIDNDTNIVGQVQYVAARAGEDLISIGQQFDIGAYEMVQANPGIPPFALKPGAKVLIPAKFILPQVKREGIVINLAEMRLYFYHPDGKFVSTYPAGIGKMGWNTPVGMTKITAKAKHPTWYPTRSIRKSYESVGRHLPASVPPGANNPLGDYALGLAWTSMLIHGTNNPNGVGVRSSNGCIRMLPADIEHLFYQVSVGTKVKIINMPYKTARHKGDMYIEVHEPLVDKYYSEMASDDELLRHALENAASKHSVWQAAKAATTKRVFGIPFRLPSNIN